MFCESWRTANVYEARADGNTITTFFSVMSSYSRGMLIPIVFVKKSNLFIEGITQ